MVLCGLAVAVVSAHLEDLENEDLLLVLGGRVHGGLLLPLLLLGKLARGLLKRLRKGLLRLAMCLGVVLGAAVWKKEGLSE